MGSLYTTLIISTIATSVLLLIVAFILYRRSAAYRWRGKVLATVSAVDQQLTELKSRLDRLKKDSASAEKSAAEEVFRRQLRRVDVSALDRFPGIGPATVVRLQNSGFATLADLYGAVRIDIPGLGDRRISDIQQAVKDLAATNWNELHSSTSASAGELRFSVERIRQEYAAAEGKLKLQIEAAYDVLRQLQSRRVLAESITFFAFIRGGLKFQIDEQILTEPIPSVPMQTENRESAKSVFLESPMSAAVVERVANQASPDLFASTPVPQSRPLSGTIATSVTHRAEQPLKIASHVPAIDEMELIVQFGFSMARADSRISKKEKDVIRRHLLARFGSERSQLNRIDGYCAHYEAAEIALDQCLQQIRARFSDSDRTSLFELAKQIADASGPRNDREQQFLDRIVRDLSLQLERQAVTTPSSVSPSPERIADPRAILEICSDIELSVELIRRQYNRLSAALAPERFTGAGAEFVAMADAKREAIRTAALALLKPFGADLDPKESPPSQDLRHNPDLDAMFSVP